MKSHLGNVMEARSSAQKFIVNLAKCAEIVWQQSVTQHVLCMITLY